MIARRRRPLLHVVARLGLAVLALEAIGAAVAVLAAPAPPTAAGVHRLDPSTSRPATTVLVMPVDADCAGCHVLQGGVIGLPEIPVIAHPLDGWRQCISCHSEDRLVTPAPGHRGIGSTVCVRCHTTASEAGPPRPHLYAWDRDCLSCHGTATAHLPPSMLERPNDLCWLCHASLETGSQDLRRPSTP